LILDDCVRDAAMARTFERWSTRGGHSVGDGPVWNVGFWENDNGGAVLLTDTYLVDEHTAAYLNPAESAAIRGVLLPLFEGCSEVSIRQEHVFAPFGTEWFTWRDWKASQPPHEALVSKLSEYLYPGWDPTDMSPHPVFWLGGAAIGDEDVKGLAVSVVRRWSRSLRPRRRHQGRDAVHAMARLASEVDFVIYPVVGSFYVFVPLDRLEGLKALVERIAEENGLGVPVGAEIII
jgi:hypothetical protein